jgi:hypothetical protein
MCPTDANYKFITIFSQKFTFMIKRNALLLSAALLMLLLSCSTTPTKNSAVEVHIAGLKKGKIYLEKVVDSTLIVLDSVRISREETHILTLDLEHPEFLILRLDKEDFNPFNDRISFFADPGNTSIKTTLDGFEKDAIIVSGPHQKEFESISKMLSDFDIKSLKLYQLSQEKEYLSPDRQDSLIRVAQRNEIRRYQYLVNYALANTNNYLTPFVIVEQGDFLQQKWKDSIYNLLSDDIKSSTYGKQLAIQLQP